MSAITQVPVKCKKPRLSLESSQNATDGEEAQPPRDQSPPDQAEESEKMEDGLAFWIATRTMAFQMCELEAHLKKILISAGFSVEECYVCHFSYLSKFGVRIFL